MSSVSEDPVLAALAACAGYGWWVSKPNGTVFDPAREAGPWPPILSVLRKPIPPYRKDALDDGGDFRGDTWVTSWDEVKALGYEHEGVAV